MKFIKHFKSKPLLLFIFPVLGQTTELKSCEETKSSSFLFGGSYTHVNFKPNGHTSFHGNLGGAQANYEYKAGHKIYEALNFCWRQGEMFGSTGKRYLVDIDTREQIGYTFAINCQKFLITPFTGFGWRYLSHNLKQPNQSSIQFYYNELYVPVGLLSDYNILSNFCFGLYVTWMPQIFPTVNIKPINNVRWVLDCTLANIQIEVPFTYRFTSSKFVWALSFKPFFQYWQDGKTLAKTTTNIALDLPSNTYKFAGAQLNAVFRF